MKTMSILLLATLATGACASGSRPAPAAAPAPTTTTTTTTATHAGHAQAAPDVIEAAARADSLRDSWNEADVAFISDMIHHHAQALVMARMAPTHGASPALRVLSGRIINAQNDEIAIMQRWLRERGQPVPDPAHAMHGGHDMHMPGMLTTEQLERLDGARGAEFDRLFLQFMIQHHEGALVMVQELFDTFGAAQGDAIFKIAADISADQNTEIQRMRLMLREMVFETEGL